MAAELFDLLGDAVFEHVGELLQQRASLSANVRRLVAGFREAEAAEKAAAAVPSYGSTVTVMSSSQVGGGRWPCKHVRVFAPCGLRFPCEGLVGADCEGFLARAPAEAGAPTPPPLPQKLLNKLERKAQRRAGKAGGAGGPAEPGDADADWIR